MMGSNEALESLNDTRFASEFKEVIDHFDRMVEGVTDVKSYKSARGRLSYFYFEAIYRSSNKDIAKLSEQAKELLDSMLEERAKESIETILAKNTMELLEPTS